MEFKVKRVDIIMIKSDETFEIVSSTKRIYWRNKNMFEFGGKSYELECTQNITEKLQNWE